MLSETTPSAARHVDTKTSVHDRDYESSASSRLRKLWDESDSESDYFDEIQLSDLNRGNDSSMKEGLRPVSKPRPRMKSKGSLIQPYFQTRKSSFQGKFQIAKRSYAKGLKHYKAGDFFEALVQFGEVITLFKYGRRQTYLKSLRSPKN